MRGTRTAAILIGIAVAATAASCSSKDPSSDETAPIRSSETVGRSVGPHGEAPSPPSALKLTPDDVRKVRAGRYTAALVWHQQSDFTTAVTDGIRDEFARLGIRIVSQTSADFNVAKQNADIETATKKHPDVMLTLPIDPVSTASAYKKAARQGTKIVVLSNLPKGLTHGRGLINVVTDDLFDMGKRAADALAAAVGGHGEVGFFFHAANEFDTRQRDKAFLETISANYPDIKVVAKQGVADPNKTQEHADGMFDQHHDLDGVFVTFSQPPGDAVLASLHAIGNTTTRIVSLDLDEQLALDMAKGGNTFALIADRAHEIGRAMALSAAYGLLGRRAPPFVTVPAVTVTKKNLVEGYRESLDRDPPASVMKALGR